MHIKGTLINSKPFEYEGDFNANVSVDKLKIYATTFYKLIEYIIFEKDKNKSDDIWEKLDNNEKKFSLLYAFGLEKSDIYEKIKDFEVL